jgi:hypothetical protein
MSRRLAALLAAGLALGACGAQSAKSALTQWVTQSSFANARQVLATDARHAASVLGRASSSGGELHTVCAVMLLDAQAANASLPTPDAVATGLLSTAYTKLAAGANECYQAASRPSRRAVALASLRAGDAALSEAAARIAASIGP